MQEKDSDPEVAAELAELAADDRIVLQRLGPGADMVMDRRLFEEMTARGKRTREGAPPQQKRKPRNPRPAPPPLTSEQEAEIEAASRITPEDVERAVQAWRFHASPAFQSLLDAQPVDDGLVLNDPAELDAASRITPDDVARARRAWEEDAPARARGLWDAQPEPPNRPKKKRPKRCN